MSEIRFIREQGDALEAAIRTESAQESRRSTRLRAPGRPRKRVAVVIVALALAGCAVAAATGFFSASERLALGKVDCYYSDGVTLPGAAGYDALVTGAPLIAGETPAQLCRHDFIINERGYVSQGMRPLQHPQVVTCKQSPTSSAVFIGTGRAFIGTYTALLRPGTLDPCQKLGLKPLPQTFDAAAASVRALATQLQTLYVTRDCWQPEAFARAVRLTLTHDGFDGWRVVLPPSINATKSAQIGLGQCAFFNAPDPRSGSSNQSLDGNNRTVNLGLTIPRSIQTVITRADETLATDLAQRCYSRTAARALVTRTFAGSGMTPKIAFTTSPNGVISWGTKAEARHWADDCPILFDSGPTLNDQDVLVWLNARNGTHIQPNTGTGPPLADFK